MKTSLRAAALTTVALALTACGSPSAQFTAADEAEVRALFDSTVTRVKEGDWTSWAGEFSDSAVFHPSNTKLLNGRAAILAWGQAFPPVEQISMWDVHVRGEGNLAYGTSAIAIKVKGAPVDTSKQLVVFQRSPAGRWDIAAVSLNSDLPAVTAAPVAGPKK
jgi:ketosteroid isomerase-like protein